MEDFTEEAEEGFGGCVRIQQGDLGKSEIKLNHSKAGQKKWVCSPSLPSSEAEAVVYVYIWLSAELRITLGEATLLFSFHSLAGPRKSNVPECSIGGKKCLSSSLLSLPRDPTLMIAVRRYFLLEGVWCSRPTSFLDTFFFFFQNQTLNASLSCSGPPPSCCSLPLGEPSSCSYPAASPTMEWALDRGRRMGRLFWALLCKADPPPHFSK